VSAANDVAPVRGPSERACGFKPPELAIRSLAAGRAVDVYFVHAPFAEAIDARGDHRVYGEVLAAIVATLGDAIGSGGDEHGTTAWLADGVVGWSTQPFECAVARAIDPTIELGLAEHLQATLRAGLGATIAGDAVEQLCVGRARVLGCSAHDPVRAFGRGLVLAQARAMDREARALGEHTALLERALAERAFVFHHQPIVDLARKEIVAYEALCRGTLDKLRFPDVIFGLAERCAKVWELGRVLRDVAAANLDAELGRRRTASGRAPALFLNVHPDDLDDPVFLEQLLSEPMLKHAHSVVIELTERAAIHDYRRVKAFFGTLRRQGYRLAIDDLGSGYAGLTSLAELEPDFIKYDMALVRDVHQHPIKARLLRRMNEFAAEIGSVTIAEGVEHGEERDALLDAGCRWMQGYLFARPAQGLPDVAPHSLTGYALDRPSPTAARPA
jgi:EAL domain-containing protein (putative c-di-GMP-specific phosphodiesterase class I)